MKISVVTVCLNSEKTIRHTIESFLAQTWPDKEMILADGGSTDRTIEIVRCFDSREIHISSQCDEGARHEGRWTREFQFARGF